MVSLSVEKKVKMIDTEILKVDRKNIELEKIKEAARLINKGDLVIFPTETVYGLGADGLNGEACKKIFLAKGRPQDNPLILHVADLDMVSKLAVGLEDKDFDLMKNLWPGPLTLIYRKSHLVPDEVTAGGPTVGIRFPSNEIANALIREAKTAIAAPSANLSGKPSPTNSADVKEDMDGRVSCIIDGGSSDIGIESTVVDMTEKNPVILRPGFYTLEYLEEYMPGISIDPALKTGAIPKSPGQKYRHYAPNAEMITFVGQPKKVRAEILSYIEAAKKENKKIGVMSFDEDEAYGVDLELKMGSFSDISEMGRMLFSNLRKFDQAKVDLILGVGVYEKGYGVSIMNRMKKASSGKIIYVD